MTKKSKGKFVPQVGKLEIDYAEFDKPEASEGATNSLDTSSLDTASDDGCDATTADESSTIMPSSLSEAIQKVRDKYAAEGERDNLGIARELGISPLELNKAYTSDPLLDAEKAQVRRDLELLDAGLENSAAEVMFAMDDEGNISLIRDEQRFDIHLEDLARVMQALQTQLQDPIVQARMGVGKGRIL